MLFFTVKNGSCVEDCPFERPCKIGSGHCQFCKNHISQYPKPYTREDYLGYVGCKLDTSTTIRVIVDANGNEKEVPENDNKPL